MKTGQLHCDIVTRLLINWDLNNNKATNLKKKLWTRKTTYWWHIIYRTKIYSLSLARKCVVIKCLSLHVRCLDLILPEPKLGMRNKKSAKCGIIWCSRWFCNPHPILRLFIALFAVAEGLLLLDIGWFVLFFEAGLTVFKMARKTSTDYSSFNPS